MQPIAPINLQTGHAGPVGNSFLNGCTGAYFPRSIRCPVQFFLGLMLWFHVLPNPSVKLKRVKPIARACSTKFPPRTRSLIDNRFTKTSSMCKTVFFGPET